MISLLIVVSETLDVTDGARLAEALPVRLPFPPTRSCGPCNGGNHHTTHFSCSLRTLRTIYIHTTTSTTIAIDVHWNSPTLNPFLYILRGAKISNLEWRIIHQLNDDQQTSGRHSTSAAAIVERHRHDSEANASQDALSAISIISSCEET